MQNLSLGLIQQGRREGKKEGRLETTIEFVKGFMNNKNMSLEEVIIFLEVKSDLKDEVIKHFKRI